MSHINVSPDAAFRQIVERDLFTPMSLCFVPDVISLSMKAKSKRTFDL